MINSRGRNSLIPTITVSFIYKSTCHVISFHHQLCTFQVRERLNVLKSCAKWQDTVKLEMCTARAQQWVSRTNTCLYIYLWLVSNWSRVSKKKKMLIDAVTCCSLYPALCGLLQSEERLGNFRMFRLPYWPNKLTRRLFRFARKAIWLRGSRKWSKYRMFDIIYFWVHTGYFYSFALRLFFMNCVLFRISNRNGKQ